MHPIKVFIAAACLGLGLLCACGVTHDSAPLAATARGELDPTSLKLYTNPNSQPLPSCDIFTKLTLADGLSGPVLGLRNERSGSCEIMLDPQDRTYNLEEVHATCGSRVFVGVRRGRNQEEPIAVKLTDHRNRHCNDTPAASLIVEETYRDGEVIVLYGKNIAP